MGGDEFELVKEDFATNWIAPLGPQVDAFEAELAERAGTKFAAALSSGTAALHLALRSLNLQPGDDLVCSTLTFSAIRMILAAAGTQQRAIDWQLIEDYLAIFRLVDRLPNLKAHYGNDRQI